MLLYPPCTTRLLVLSPPLYGSKRTLLPCLKSFGLLTAIALRSRPLVVRFNTCPVTLEM